jgi:hypothetical protein
MPVMSINKESINYTEMDISSTVQLGTRHLLLSWYFPPE